MIAQLEETTGALIAQPSESSTTGWVDSQLSAATRKTTITGISSSRRTWAISTKNIIVGTWEMDAEAGTQDGDADGLSSSFTGLASDTPNE